GGTGESPGPWFSLPQCLGAAAPTGPLMVAQRRRGCQPAGNLVPRRTTRHNIRRRVTAGRRIGISATFWGREHGSPRTRIGGPGPETGGSAAGRHLAHGRSVRCPGEAFRRVG